MAPLPDTSVVIHDRPKAQRAQAKAEQFGFRVAGSRLASGIGIGLGAGFATGMALDLGLGFWPCVLALASVGAVLGRRRSAPACSGCGRGVADGAERCNFCGLRLVGDIRQLVERFDAEERYRASLRGNEAQRREQARASAAQCCPSCQWVPLETDRWACTCGHRWNTFDTGARCPSCDKHWKTTTCLSCKATSPHDDWYVDETRGTHGE